MRRRSATTLSSPDRGESPSEMPRCIGDPFAAHPDNSAKLEESVDDAGIASQYNRNAGSG